MDYEMLNNIKIEELKNFLQVTGKKKRNLTSKNIFCYKKGCYLSEDSTRSGSPTPGRIF